MSHKVHVTGRGSFVLVLFICFQAALFIGLPVLCQAQEKKLVIFGSSVANGSGDTTGAGGYAGHVKKMMEARGWTVVNISKGGDNTTKILPRFYSQLLPEKPTVAVIGLSLGNEGIMASTELERARVFEKFRSGLVHLIRLCRENGIKPVVVNCYARSDFGEEQYEATKKMNLLIASWEVPSVNVLGAIDNGKGKWLEGYAHDRSHPDYKGHLEMFRTFVPGLFDALAKGKPIPEKVRDPNYLHTGNDPGPDPVLFRPDDTLYSFSVSFCLKIRNSGAFAGITDGKGSAWLGLNNNRLIYHSSGGQTAGSDTTDENRGWQYICVTHQHATGLTRVYFNGKEAGSCIEPLTLTRFVLGAGGSLCPGKAAAMTGYRDLAIYRSALNPDEVTALYHNQLPASSLEVYAPLNDTTFVKGSLVKNMAQSMSKLIINSGTLESRKN